MRLRRLLILLCAALALAACARQAPRYAAAPAARAVRARRADVWRAAAGVLRRAPRRRRSCRSPRRSTDGPYTLDSGDKLRIVVFGQDALSNNYTVDAQGAGQPAAGRRGRGARPDHGATGQRHRRRG